MIVSPSYASESYADITSLCDSGDLLLKNLVLWTLVQLLKNLTAFQSLSMSDVHIPSACSISSDQLPIPLLRPNFSI